jgi:hypothetical protein
MSPHDARELIDALARGIDPRTGAALQAPGPLDDPQVIRALFVASQLLAAAAKRVTPAPQRPGNAGKPWTAEEETLLAEAFDQGTSLRDLAQRHGRSPGGIAARLVRLGKIEERRDVLRRPAAQA